MARILVVDDEKVMVKGIRFNLENEGYTVDVGYNGRQAVDLARANDYDLIILDLMMPELDGLEACMEIRAFSSVPIIMLTARGEDTDKLLGFEYGADDYITKPFNILEVKARVKALLRRTGTARRQAERQDQISLGGLTGLPKLIGHACEVETSSCLYLCPETVREDRVPGIMQDSMLTRDSFIKGGAAWSWKNDASRNGALGDARKATYEIGKAMTEEALDYMEKLVDEIIERH